MRQELAILMHFGGLAKRFAEEDRGRFRTEGEAKDCKGRGGGGEVFDGINGIMELISGKYRRGVLDRINEIYGIRKR